MGAAQLIQLRSSMNLICEFMPYPRDADLRYHSIPILGQLIPVPNYHIHYTIKRQSPMVSQSSFVLVRIKRFLLFYYNPPQQRQHISFDQMYLRQNSQRRRRRTVKNVKHLQLFKPLPALSWVLVLLVVLLLSSF